MICLDTIFPKYRIIFPDSSSNLILPNTMHNKLESNLPTCDHQPLSLVDIFPIRMLCVILASFIMNSVGSRKSNKMMDIFTSTILSQNSNFYKSCGTTILFTFGMITSNAGRILYLMKSRCELNKSVEF